MNLYDVSGLAHYELYRAITQAGNPPGLEVTQAQLLADLMTREWSGLADPDEPAGSPLERLAAGVASTVGALRDNELFAKIVHVDPELLLPYLLDRRTDCPYN